MWSMIAQSVLYLDDTLDGPTSLGFALFSGVVTLPVVFYAGLPFLRAGWRTIRAGAPGMDVLVSLGALGALFVSVWRLIQGDANVFFDTAGMLVTFLLLARVIDLSIRQRGAFAMQAVLSVAPDQVRVRDADSTERLLSARRVEPGMEALIAVGETVAVDGLVLDGESELDRARLTGESAPVLVRAGDLVEAGAVNLVAPLVVRIAAGYGNRHVDLIAKRVRELLSSRSHLQALSERFARLLVPLLLVLASAGAALAVASGSSWIEAATRAIAVIVITCPCALALAVPLALIAATTEAARNGVILQDVSAIERGARIDTIYFDKTGTLTIGRPVLVKVVTVPSMSREALLALAARAEAASTHPLARAIRAAAPAQPQESGHIERICGLGVVWRDGADTIIAGQRRLLEQHGIAPLTVEGSAVATEVHVAHNGRAVGYLLFADSLQPAAANTIGALHSKGFCVGLISGDRELVAREAAKQAGLRDEAVSAGLSPEAKAERIVAAQRNGACVMFVGDGVNDGPALAAADIGVAVSGAAMPALTAASIILRRGGIEQVPDLLDLLQRTQRVIRQNLIWALAYNVCAIPLALTGRIAPLVAVLAMALSSLTVTLNSARLLRPRANHLRDLSTR
jgi:heavy metal translocating P-type ATPase